MELLKEGAEAWDLLKKFKELKNDPKNEFIWEIIFVD
jgi:hypothetical protein